MIMNIIFVATLIILTIEAFVFVGELIENFNVAELVLLVATVVAMYGVYMSIVGGSL